MLAIRIAITAMLLAACALPAQAFAATTPSADIDLHRIAWSPSDVFGVGVGLPDPTVNAIASMPNGDVWLGTMHGLARQAGARIRAEHGPDNVLDVAIFDLAATPDGDLLVATDGHGIWRLHDGAWTSLGSPFGSGRAQRLRLFDDHGRQRVLTAGAGVAELVGDQWRTFTMPARLLGLEQYDIALEPAHGTVAETLWIASFGPPGLYRCSGDHACEPVWIPGPGPRTNEIHALRLQAMGKDRNALWVALHGGGVARLLDGHWTRWTTGNSDLPSDFVDSLELVSGPGGGTEAWIGTRSGLAILLDDGSWIQADPRIPQLHDRIQTIASARDGQGHAQVWIGSDTGAVRTRPTAPWHLVSTLGHDGNGVWALLVERASDGNQRLWLGGDDTGLALLDHNRWRMFSSADGLPNRTIRSIARVPDGSAEGQLWVGTWGGRLARMQGERFVEVPTPWPKPDNEAASVLLTSRNDIWASTRRNGIGHWDGQRWQWWPPATSGMPGRAYSALRVGSDVWFSTSDRGLARYRNGAWRFFETDIGLPADNFLDMHLIPDEQGNPVLWIGSYRHGLLRVDIRDPDRPRAVNTPALPDMDVPYVYGAVRDGRGDIVVCTNYGVFDLKRKDAGFAATEYHRVDGLPHDECNAGAMQTDDEGRVWIGTIGGAAVYDPPDPRPRRAASLHLVAVLVDGQAVAAPAGVVQLPRADSTLEIDYELHTGELEDRNRYRVSLVGGDARATHWESANAHAFTQLPAGHQRIRIEAMDADGVAAAPLELQVDVPKLWWHTYLAWAVAALAVLLLLRGVMKLRERGLRQREEQLRDMVQDRARQLHNRENELRSANAELRRLSYTDPLTGLGNRRRLFETLELLWRDAARRHEPLALLLIDLDYFKRFNDAYGHQAGDARLQQVSQLLQSMLPPGASAARYGGEELCVLLPDRDMESAARFAEELRRAIASHPTDIALPDAAGIAITASIGVAACVPDPERRPDTLIARADRALYAAKDAGRNRVECG